MRERFGCGVLALAIVLLQAADGQAAPPKARAADAALDRALRELAVFEALHRAEERAVCAALARN